MTALEYKPNGEPISERSLAPIDQEYCDELDDPSTEELLRQLDVAVPDDKDVEEANICDNLQLSNTLALYYRENTYFVDPSDYDDICFFLTSVLDTFFGFHGTNTDKKEFNSVLKKLLTHVPDSLFNDPDNKLLKLLVPIPGDATLMEFCERVKDWTEERYRLLLCCAGSVYCLPKNFLHKHSLRTMFRKVVYDTENTYGNCRESGWAYSQVKSFLDSCCSV